MDAAMEKECSALGGLFQTIMNDMKSSYPTWEDFINKAVKLQSQLRTTITVTGSFLDAFQKIADMAISSRGATKEIGSALTRMCMRHRSIETRLKQFTVALTDSLINPLEVKVEEWKKVASQLDKDHAKEYKKARTEIKKKSSDTLKLQKKVKKGKDDVRMQLDSALQDVNEKYLLLEETEKTAVCRALIEERGRFCTFVTMLKPVLDEEIGMLGEVTHLQTILEDLINLTAEPSKLPPTSEQVILDLKGSDYSFTYHTPPGSPTSLMSRKASVNSYQHTSMRHVPSMDSISSSMEGLFLRPPSVLLPDGTSQATSCLRLRSITEGVMLKHWGRSQVPLAPAAGRLKNIIGIDWEISHEDCMDQPMMNNLQQKAGPAYPNNENGTAVLNQPGVYQQSSDRPRAMTSSATCKPQVGDVTAREQLALNLSHGFNTEAQHSSRDSLHCSSGYSTQTTTPSCSEDTIPSHAAKKDPSLYVAEYDYISLPGDQEVSDQLDFDKSCTIPRNSDISQNYRKMFQSKRPASTVSLLADPEPIIRSPHVATIRRKPSTKPPFRRGTISGVPIPIRTPVVPVKAPVLLNVPLGLSSGRTASEEFVSVYTGKSDLSQVKPGLCTSTQSLSAIQTPYYSFIPKQEHLSAHHQHMPTIGQHKALVNTPVPVVNSTVEKQPTPHAATALDLQRAVSMDASCNSAHPEANVPNQGEGGDMLKMIRRGVSLRKTITNDRSAPQLK
nr:PREDICTED: metastasis suppressor protein 1-like isoform X1 [Latimeria chalumnae]|eukprot:XP_014342595.1 PREDICTED: metastasis suppressor protein 1-like isoform X1 [Latimeria chalumnae]